MKKWLLFVTICLFLLSSVVSAMAAVESTFHGQFRINFYSLSQEKDIGTGTAAERLRWRPTWDAKISNDVSMHMQLNIGHIESNTANARYNNSADPAVALRHAMITFTAPEIGGKIVAGLVPLSDKFGDTLFSGDWDFNPLAIAWMGKVGEADIRLGGGKLSESNTSKDDDIDIYLGDVDLPVGNGSVGGSVYVARSGDAGTSLTTLGDLGGTLTENYIGIRASQEINIVKLNGFFLYNTGKVENCTFCTGSASGKDVDNSGYAVKVEGTVPIGSANAGLIFITTSGDKEIWTTDSSNSFITPMAIIDHHGYWGYTGKLNIQGPTDTGIDNPLRVDGSVYGGSGLGYGIMTVQAKVDFPVTDKLTGYGAVGVFQHQNVPSGKEKSIGTDFYLQGKYNIAQNLNLEAGLDYASINKNNTAYDPSATWTKDNTITLLFARLQLEY